MEATKTSTPRAPIASPEPSNGHHDKAEKSRESAGIREAAWIRETMAGTPVAPWLDHAARHRVQILVTTPTTEHAFRVDAEYVYPASAIKTFLSVAALRALRERTDAPLTPHPFAHTIDRLQRFSDNAAFTELYDFVGHRALNEMWWRLGFDSVRFHHRMGGTREEGLRHPGVTVRIGDDHLRRDAHRSDLVLPPTDATGLEIGRRHRLRNGRVLAEPMRFAEKNYVSLRDLQRLNISLLEPKHPSAVRLGLHAEDRSLLVEAMTRRAQDATHHKPLLTGIRRVVPDRHIRYVGKSGRAYGFHIANAYIEHTDTGRRFYVTAAIHDNPNGVMNDDRYNYEGATIPFMTALGEALARQLLR